MNARTALAAIAICSACAHAQEDYPAFDEPELRQGREIWLATCAACHTSDLAGAPQVNDRDAWAPRIQQGKAVLYEHALNGLHGAQGTQMPPRGGNSSLSDAQVKAAVDYMVALVMKLSGERT